MAPNLCIVVFRGDPVDLQSTRHTALFVNEGSQLYGDLVHVTGSSGFYEFERKSEINPLTSRSFLNKIPVTPIANSPTKEQLLEEIKKTRINNSTHAWNCQNWVGDALNRVAAKGWISSQSKSSAIDAMVDVIIDAEDEQK
ncbi:hypothetical protein DV735_g5421, partial [Chaetothyriales sp. CBS 134920]